MTRFVDKSLTLLLSFLRRYRYAYLLFVALSLVGSIYVIRHLEIRSGFEDLLPQNSRAVQVLKEIPKKVGGAKYVKIAIVSDDLSASQRFVEDYVARLRQFDEIQYIRYKYGNKFFKDHFLQYLDVADLVEIRDKIAAHIEHEKRKANPFYFELEESEAPKLDFLDLESKYAGVEEFKDEDYYVTKDKKVIFVLARPRGYASNIAYSRKLLDDLRQIAAQLQPKSYHPSLEVHWLGAHFANVVEYEALISDVRSTSLIAVVLLLLLYYFYCRRFKVLLYILIGPLVSVIWTAAATYFLIGHVNSQTAFLGAILLGLVDMSIHLTSRYFEERQHQVPIFAALHTTLKKTGYAVIVSSLTLIVAFLSLVFSDFVGFWQFGLLAATGVVLSMVSNCTLIPALVFTLERDGSPTSGLRTQRNLFIYYENLVDRIRPTARWPRYTLAASALVAAASLATIPFIDFEYDLRNLRSTAFTNEELTNRLEEITGSGTSPSVIFLADGLPEVEELHATLTTMAANPQSTIRSIKSVYSLVPEVLPLKLPILDEIRALVADGERYLKFSGKKADQLQEFKGYLNMPPVEMHKIPEEYLVEFRDPQGNLGSFVMLYPKAEEAQMREMMQHAAEVREVRGPSGKMYYSSGESVIFSDMLKLMKVDGRRAIVITFFAIFFIILLQTKRLRDTLVILAPLYVGVLMICSVMLIFGIKLNFFNIIIFPMILGIGIDSNIHIFERFVEFGYRDVKGAMRSTGRGILLTTLTTVIGFWSLLFAKSKALNSVGVLAITGVCLCCLAAFTTLPALLSRVRFKKLWADDSAGAVARQDNAQSA